MAAAFVAVVSRFGIAAKVSYMVCKGKQANTPLQVGTVTADNASNNDLLMDALQRMLPNFRGRRCRVRCYAHILNLTAKAILRQFEVQKKKGNTPEDDNDSNPFHFLGPMGGGLDNDDEEPEECDTDSVNLDELTMVPVRQMTMRRL